MCSSILRRRSVSSTAIRVTGIPVHMLTTSAISSLVTESFSSLVLACHSSCSCCNFSASFNSRSRSSAAYSYCCCEMASSFSRRTVSNTFLDSLTDSGVPLERIRTLEPASSIRSIALSGRYLSAMNRDASVAAACRASSSMVTP